MDFDVDGVEESFDDMMLAAKQDILKGQCIEKCLPDLIDRYDVFKDISKEAVTRGRLLGSVLVAAEGMTRVIAAQAADVSPCCSQAESALLVSLAAMYTELYTTSPVPTAAQWRTAVLLRFSPSDVHVLDESSASSGVPPQPSALPSYAVPLLQILDCGSSAAADDHDAVADGDDGSLAESEMKSFLRRCVQLVRKCGRAVPLATAASSREMISCVSQYISGGTLEW